ncbi:MAG: lipid IV(A) 3-deoxy-D-manno-octulosonic acid transferase [Leucothrix sp.]
MPAYRLLYSLLGYLIFPVMLLRLFWRSRQDASIRQHWPQRFGFIKLSKSPRIWLHAVSVGETIAAKPLVKGLLADFPDHQLLISNTTATGYQTSVRLFGERVEHCYFPYDLNRSVTRFLTQANPQLLIIMETEIWPNLLYHCKQRNIPTLIANARLSERSTRGYSNILPLISPAIRALSKIACRSQQDASNFQRLGAAGDQLAVIGNIKFDVSANVLNTNTATLKQQLSPNHIIWVAASTHAGEDEIIIDCFKTLKVNHPHLVLVLVPRHPERFESVYELCNRSGLIIQRRSDQQLFTQSCDIILGDSMGEMNFWYTSADVVFMGGSLVETGGHNPLEASVYGVPVVSGPAVFNFHDVFEVLCEQKVAWVEASPTALVAKLSELLAMEQDDLANLKNRAIQTIAKQSGATKTLRKLSKALISSS